MILREVRPGDAAALAELAGQLGYPTTGGDIERRLSAVRPGPGRAVFVADDGSGGLLGWVEVRGVELLIADRYADLAALIVDERHRGQGIGRSLLERALVWAHDNGYALLRVRSNVIRERAHRFYEDLGFEREKTSAVFRRATGPDLPRLDARA